VIGLLTSRADSVAVTHGPPPGFKRGHAIPLVLLVAGAARDEIAGAVVRYRRLDQSEAYRSVEMEPDGARGWRAEVPPDYADSPFPVQYFFVLRGRVRTAWQHPGLGQDLCGQPYFVVRSSVRSGTAAPAKALPGQM
jgi:hypothetical protein